MTGKRHVVLGVLGVAALGLVLVFAGRIPFLGRLPGDFTFTRDNVTIHLPLARPALAGAALLVFVDCLKELPATLLLRPLNVETLATSIYQFASRGSFEEGALAALLIIAASIGPVAWLTRFSDMPNGPA